MAKDKQNTVDMMVSRTTDDLIYYVTQVGEETTLVTRVEFGEDHKPDPLTGAIIAVCSSAGEEPFDALMAVARYLVDDNDACDAAHDYLRKHFDELREAMEAEAKEAKDEPKTDPDKERKEQLVDMLKDLLDL